MKKPENKFKPGLDSLQLLKLDTEGYFISFYEEKKIEGNLDDWYKTIFCKECGGSNFEVGRGIYWTGIRCVNCKWEETVHSG